MISITYILLLVISTCWAQNCSYYYSEFSLHCNLVCEDLGWFDGVHPGHVAGLYAPNLQENCGETVYNFLRFNNCSFPNQRLEGDWFTDEVTPKFDGLVFHGSDLVSIEDGAIARYQAFNHSLLTLNFYVTPNLTHISQGILQDIYKDKSSLLVWQTEGVLDYVEVEAISKIAPTLVSLTVGNVALQDVKSLANISGICQPEQLTNALSLNYLQFRYGFGINVFGKDLISQLNSSRLNSVLMQQAGIQYFEDNTAFEPFAAQPNNLTEFWFRWNGIVTIPHGLFAPLQRLGQQIEMLFEGYKYQCDGNLQYFQDVLRNDTDNLDFIDVNSIVCGSPPSQEGFLVIDADLSGEFKVLPPAPRLNIICD